jgi:hypothetical protein
LLGSGTFTLHGARVALPSFQNPPAAVLDHFHGIASFLISNFDDRIVSNEDANGSKILALGLLGGVDVPDFFVMGGSSKRQAVLADSRNAIRRGSSVKIPDRGSLDPPFLRQMLEQTRAEQPQLIQDLPSGVSDVRFYRVSVSNALVGIHLQP